MVEILGVLAIIGVLSIGGLLGFNHAMKKRRLNEIVNTVDLITVEVITTFSQQDYPEPGQSKEITETMIKNGTFAESDQILTFLSTPTVENGGKENILLEIYFKKASTFACQRAEMNFQSYIIDVAIIKDTVEFASIGKLKRDEWMATCAIFDTGGVQAAEPEGIWLKVSIDVNDILSRGKIDDGKGLKICQEGQYKEKDTCKSCPKNCLVCSDKNSCEKCSPSHPIWNTTGFFCTQCP